MKVSIIAILRSALIQLQEVRRYGSTHTDYVLYKKESMVSLQTIAPRGNEHESPVGEILLKEMDEIETYLASHSFTDQFHPFIFFDRGY